MDPGAGRRGLDRRRYLDLGGKRAVIRGKAYAGPVERLRMQNAGTARGEHAVDGQERALNRKRRSRGAGEAIAKHPARKGETAPGPPFVQVAAENDGTRRLAKQELSHRPHLHDAKRLGERKMRSDDAEGAPVLADVENNRAPVAVAGQIQERDLLDLDAGACEEAHTEKSVAFGAPKAPPVPLDVAQPRASLDTDKIEYTSMRWTFLVGFLQDQEVGTPPDDLPHQNIRGAGRVDHTVLPAPPVDVPTRDRQNRQSVLLFPRLPTFGSNGSTSR